MRRPKDIKIGNLTLQEIIEEHQHWTCQDCEGWKDMCANLSDVDLHDVDLHCVNLSGANLSHSNLRGADLDSAILSHTDLCGASLSGSSLYSTNLFYSNLRGSDLSNTFLNCANLACCDLRDANLYNAILYDAILCHSILDRADLSNADLSDANLGECLLRDTNLSNTCFSRANLAHTSMYSAVGKQMEYRRGKVLTEPLIGYKKCININHRKDINDIIRDVIVTLEIPRGAIVFSINGIKLRTNKAKVISIEGADRAFSIHNHMSYYVGDEITIYDFNCQYNIECAEGIHFFLTREEAENY